MFHVSSGRAWYEAVMLREKVFDANESREDYNLPEHSSLSMNTKLISYGEGH